jgi:hypothetical protein
MGRQNQFWQTNLITEDRFCTCIHLVRYAERQTPIAKQTGRSASQLLTSQESVKMKPKVVSKIDCDGLGRGFNPK